MEKSDFGNYILTVNPTLFEETSFTIQLADSREVRVGLIVGCTLAVVIVIGAIGAYTWKQHGQTVKVI